MQVLKAKKKPMTFVKTDHVKTCYNLACNFFSTQQRFIPMLKSVYHRVNILKEIGIIIPLEITL